MKGKETIWRSISSGSKLNDAAKISVGGKNIGTVKDLQCHNIEADFYKKLTAGDSIKFESVEFSFIASPSLTIYVKYFKNKLIKKFHTIDEQSAVTYIQSQDQLIKPDMFQILRIKQQIEGQINQKIVANKPNKKAEILFMQESNELDNQDKIDIHELIKEIDGKKKVDGGGAQGPEDDMQVVLYKRADVQEDGPVNNEFVFNEAVLQRLMYDFNPYVYTLQRSYYIDNSPPLALKWDGQSSTEHSSYFGRIKGSFYSQLSSLSNKWNELKLSFTQFSWFGSAQEDSNALVLFKESSKFDIFTQTVDYLSSGIQIKKSYEALDNKDENTAYHAANIVVQAVLLDHLYDGRPLSNPAILATIAPYLIQGDNENQHQHSVLSNLLSNLPALVVGGVALLLNYKFGHSNDHLESVSTAIKTLYVLNYAYGKVNDYLANDNNNGTDNEFCRDYKTTDNMLSEEIHEQHCQPKENYYSFGDPSSAFEAKSSSELNDADNMTDTSELMN